MTDENYITDPDSASVETIVHRIIENTAHASKKVDELHDWTVTGTGQLLLIQPCLLRILPPLSGA